VTPNDQPKDYTICAESRYNSDVYGTDATTVSSVYTFKDPGEPTVTRGYRIERDCNTTNPNGRVYCETSVTDAPRVTTARFFTEYFSVGTGGPVRNFALPLGPVSQVKAYNCIRFVSTDNPCSSQGAVVTADSGYPQYRTSVSYDSCKVRAETVNVTVNANANDYVKSAPIWLDQNNDVTAVRSQMVKAQVTVSFKNQLSGMSDVRMTLNCTDPVQPDPIPTPTPTPAPSPTP
jgi:hypothetical protein